MRKTQKIVFAVLIVSVLMSFSQKQTNYFVSTSGNDLNAGTKEAPFATLEKAFELVKENRAGGDNSFVQINIAGGTYFVSKTIVVSEKLSDISIQNNQNEEIIFFGGVSIPKESIKNVVRKDGVTKR